MQTEIITLHENESPLTNCLVCGRILNVKVNTIERGDDYGSWPEYSIYFECGHDFEQMILSLKHKDEI